MPGNGLDFTSVDSIRNWAIQLANACGGSQIMFGRIKPPNATKANELLDEFAKAWDTQLIKGGKKNEPGTEEE